MNQDVQHSTNAKRLSPRGELEEDFFEDTIRRFEQAWLRGDRPAIDEYLVKNGDGDLPLLVELVHADLEFRLRAGQPARVEEYLARFPLLNTTSEQVFDLASTELRVRRLLGECVSDEEFQQRFGQRFGGSASTDLASEITLASPDHPIIGSYKLLEMI